VNSDLPTIYPPNEKGFVRTWLSPDDARADLRASCTSLALMPKSDATRAFENKKRRLQYNEAGTLLIKPST
jgi:hypothetical protein